MKINTKKITSLALATMIAIGSTGAYAASFTDVKGHWAKTYIDRGNELGILKGYDDGTFKPSKSIARIEAMSLSARTMNLPQSEIDKAVTQYKKTIVDHKLGDWVIEDLSVALSQGIIDIDILSKLKHDNGSFTLSSREEVAILLVKAMGLQGEAEKLGTNVVLPFKDNKKITKTAKPYVAILNKHKIIQGDENNNFNPKDAIDRASMSKVVSLTYDFIAQKKTDDEQVKPKPEEIEKVSGKISTIFESAGDKYILIVTSAGERVNYKLDEKSQLKLDGKIISYSDLIDGLEVKITVVEDKDSITQTIKTLEAENKIERIDGSIYELGNSDVKSLVIEHQANGVFERRTINLKDNTVIFLDKKEAKFSDLRKQDRIKIRVINNVIDEIEAESYIRQVEGVLKNVDPDAKYIDIKTPDGTEVRYILGEDFYVTRNGDSVNLSQLRKGDKVELTVADNIVTGIDAKVVKSYVEGEIKSKKIDANSGEITIINVENRKEETYVVPSNVLVELDGKRVVLDKLELGHYVKINLEGQEVVDVTGTTTNLEDKYLGRITHAGTTFLEVTLNTGKQVEVDIKKATISDLAGFSIGAMPLVKGDTVLIIGDIYGDEIVASQVMRFSK